MILFIFHSDLSAISLSINVTKLKKNETKIYIGELFYLNVPVLIFPPRIEMSTNYLQPFLTKHFIHFPKTRNLNSKNTFKIV